MTQTPHDTARIWLAEGYCRFLGHRTHAPAECRDGQLFADNRLSVPGVEVERHDGPIGLCGHVVRNAGKPTHTQVVIRLPAQPITPGGLIVIEPQERTEEPRRATAEEIRIARAWVDETLPSFTNDDDDDRQAEYVHALEILIFANGGRYAQRHWELPPEPDPEVTAVRDRLGDLWRREAKGWRLAKPLGALWSWTTLLRQMSPLTDASAESAGGGTR